MWTQKQTMKLLNRNILIFVLTALLLGTACALSDKRLCADPDCKEIISMGKGLINYPALEEGMVAFKINSQIRIKSKSAGNDQLLWGIEVNGREGYAPKKFIRETKKLVSDKNLKYTVDVKPVNAAPILTTSEELVAQENTVEKTTTQPLNLTPVVSTENPLKNSPDEKLTTETSPVATPVMSEIVDGTKVPMFNNDSDESDKNLHDKSEVVQKLETKQEIYYGDVYSDYNEDEDQKTEHYEEQKPDSNNKFLKESKDIKLNVNDKNDKTEQVEKDVKIKMDFVSSEKSSINKETFSEILKEGKTSKSMDDIVKKDEGNQQVKKESSNTNILKKSAILSEFSEEANIEIVNNLQTNSDKKQTTENENRVNIEHIEKEDTRIEVQSEHSAEAKKYPKDNSSETSRQISIEIKEGVKNNLESDRIDENVKNHDVLGEITKQFIYNSVNSSNDNLETAKGQELSPKNETLDMKDTEVPMDLTLKNKETMDLNLKNKETIKADKSIEQQKIQAEYKTNKQMQIGNINRSPRETESLQLYKEKNILSEPVNTESVTSSNADKQQKASGDNLLQNNELILNTTPKMSEEVLSGEEIVKEDIYQPTYNAQSQQHFTGTQPKEISSDSLQHTSNAIEEDKSTNNDNQASDNTDIDVENIDIVEQITNYNTIVSSSDDNSNNQRKPQTEKDYNDYPYQQVKTDNKIEIVNTNSFATEKVDLPYYSPTKESIVTDSSTSLKSEEKVNTPVLQTEEVVSNTTPKMPGEALIQEEIAIENMNAFLNTPLPTQYEEVPTTNIPPNVNYDQQHKGLQENLHSFDEQTTGSYISVSATPSETVSQPLQKKDEQLPALPASTSSFDNYEAKENKGLFAIIIGTVNTMLSINKKNKQNEYNGDHEFDSAMFSKNEDEYKVEQINDGNILQYCKNISPNGDCPETEENHETTTAYFHQESTKSILGTDLTLETFLQILASKILEIRELLAFLFIAALSCLFFLFGYYCFCNSSREGALLSKLNELESSLLATHKENAILKHNLMSTRQKLVSIEDNSFGSNDMVVSLRKELEEELMEKARLQEQITILQKELENAADAGIELNKIVSELLSHQTGDESIISSVEELQKQLNEQQNTILEINSSLAEKSRENSELQLLIAEQNARYETELANVQRDNDELEHEKGNLLTRLDEMKNDFDNDITAALEGKNLEIKRLQNEIVDLTNKLENEHIKRQTSVAKIEALEECLKNVRKDPHVNIAEVIDVVNVKAQLIETHNKYTSLKERLETESDSRKLAENQLEVVSAEVEKLKQDFNQSEKDKLEAQTRLEVLSNYFKDKENQLQKELSLKEAMWLKQQGETTTTVDRVTAMQEEIQSLKSQNDSLRAEIEAQVAAHKAQTGTLENRAHETWLAARQSDRRYEEARAEATALRRKLTTLAGGSFNETNKPTAGSAGLGDEAPSPIHMESPGSPLLGRMPPPPFLPPPFMGPPPPFMGMPPPPPFVPPGEMRPAPLGRIMSPPPQRSGRFSPQHLDYEDYFDYDGNNTWHRHTYSPTPRTYRSLSPTDSRYNYGTERDLMSTYDTETDFSPPPSPRESRRRGGNSSERIDSTSNTKISYGNTKKFSTSSKGLLSSDSEKSFNTPSHNDNKSKKGNASFGGKTLV